jgi:transmembrane sensor
MPSEARAAQLLQQALTLLAAMHGDDGPRRQRAEQAALRWRQASAQQAQVWQEAEARWTLVSRHLPQLQTALPARPDRAPALASRRRVLRKSAQGAGLLTLAGLAWAGSWWMLPSYRLALSTARAELLPWQLLPDGSRLELAADTQLQVRYGRSWREVTLAHGQASFDVAHDVHRPFVVKTRLGEVRVLGTAFSVADRGGRIQVAVERGRVAVYGRSEVWRPFGLGAEQAPPRRVLTVGQSVMWAADGRLGEVASGADVARWSHAGRQGWWVFANSPLSEVVAELNAYLEPPVGLAPGAAELRLSGSFRMAKPEELFASLPLVLAVRVERHAAGWQISPR